MSGLLGGEKWRAEDVEGESLLPTLLALLSTRESGRKEILTSDSALENTFYSTPLDLLHPFTPTRTRSDLERRSSSTTLDPPASPFSSGLPRGTGPQQLLGLHKRLTRTASDPIKLREGAKSWKSDETTSSESGIKDPTAAARYKTELCRQFDESGLCKYGEKCQFAHGKGELRRMSRHPKYKTDKCKTYHTTGYCPYGIRCHFVHEDDETVDNVAKKQQVEQQEESNIEERLQSILLEQQIEQLLEQQRQHQQQQRKQELLIAALTQATQRRYSSQLTDRSLSLHSPNPFSSPSLSLHSPNPFSSPRFTPSPLPHGPSLYDSIGSLARSSSPSSVSGSPTSSPSLSMFESLRVAEDPTSFDSFHSGVEPTPAQLAPGYGRSTSVFHSPDPAASHSRNSPVFPMKSGSFGAGNILDVTDSHATHIEEPIASLNDAMLDDVISVLQDLVFRRVKQMTEVSISGSPVYEPVSPQFTLPSLTGVM